MFSRTTLLILLLAIVATAQIQRNPPRTCGVDTACHPWDTESGPYCGRGNDMNLRFVIDISTENSAVFTPSDAAQSLNHMTYGFCPRVDELQAFNLTDAGRFMATSIPPNNVTNLTYTSNLKTKYVHAFGFGDLGAVEMAEGESYGRAIVVDNTTNACAPGLGVASFLVLNVSFDNGKFKYFPDESPQPQGTGFVPSCDGGVCMYDPDQICIGEEGHQMCAKCYYPETSEADLETISELPIQIWVSYYGTDSRGRHLRSGANNPMNFRVFSGSGVYASVGDSMDRLKAGKTAQDDQLAP